MRYKVEPDNILKELGIYEPENIDLDLIAFSLDAEVKYSSLDDCEGNIIGTDTKAIISINQNARFERQRFSLGHELGHWINDRQKNLSYRCSANDMNQRSLKKDDFKQNKEVRANHFSADLLMPNYIYQKYLIDKSITFNTVKYLAEKFRVSLTSTAIRLVETCELPCMLVCWGDNGKRNWFVRNSIVPESIWPCANIRLTGEFTDGIEVDSDKWINSDNADEFTVTESYFSNSYAYFTLIWWKDESQLLGVQRAER